MNEKYYSLVTNVGKAQIANALAMGEKLKLGNFLVGDGNGAMYDPKEDQKGLINKVWQGPVRSLTVGEKNPNELIIDTYIPTKDGGFTIREFGIEDDKGNLIIVGKHPETYKPLASDGTSKDITIRVILSIANAEDVIIQIDPSIQMATIQDLRKHETDPKAHEGIFTARVDFDNHINDSSIHTTAIEKGMYKEVVSLGKEHFNNNDIHVDLAFKDKVEQANQSTKENKKDIENLLNLSNSLKESLDKMYHSFFTDIRENEINISFESLEGVKLSKGNYNEDKRRVEV